MTLCQLLVVTQLHIRDELVHPPGGNTFGIQLIQLSRVAAGWFRCEEPGHDGADYAESAEEPGSVVGPVGTFGINWSIG